MAYAVSPRRERTAECRLVSRTPAVCLLILELATLECNIIDLERYSKVAINQPHQINDVLEVQCRPIPVQIPTLQLAPMPFTVEGKLHVIGYLLDDSKLSVLLKACFF